MQNLNNRQINSKYNASLQAREGTEGKQDQVSICAHCLRPKPMTQVNTTFY